MPAAQPTAGVGGPPTPAVGWAAGIERLAMLVGERQEAVIDVVVVVEDDALLDRGIQAVSDLRRAGFSAELVASGSPRKRFDKAAKMGAESIASIASHEGVVKISLKAENDIRARIEGFFE